MQVRIKPVVLFLGGMMTSFILFMLLGFDRPLSKKTGQSMPDNVGNYWTVPSIPDKFTFAGEEVPLHKPEVWEYFDRNFTQIYYQTGTMLNVMKLTTRWFPMIEERLKYHGVPDDFKYLAIAESNLRNLTSRAGAVGFWQFMPATAKGYNMVVGNSVDERYNVLKSTDAACKYLKEAYALFGTWTAAAASYNCGRGGYNSRAVHQGTKDYYSLQLPEETNNYIFRILSFKYLFENADALGYKITKDDKYSPLNTRSVEVHSSVSNLSTFARQNGTSYKVLKILNPWMRDKNLVVPGGKSFRVLLPADEESSVHR